MRLLSYAPFLLLLAASAGCADAVTAPSAPRPVRSPADAVPPQLVPEVVSRRDHAVSGTIRICRMARAEGSMPALVVIDGAVLSHDEFLLGALQPDDIASIEILKGSIALAQYGPRASQGVILITTTRPASPPAPPR